MYNETFSLLNIKGTRDLQNEKSENDAVFHHKFEFLSYDDFNASYLDSKATRLAFKGPRINSWQVCSQNAEAESLAALNRY